MFQFMIAFMQGGPLPAINGPMSPRLEWRYDWSQFLFAISQTFHHFPSILLGKNSSKFIDLSKPRFGASGIGRECEATGL